MRILNIIGISIYLVIALVLAVKRFRLNQDFRNHKIKKDDYDRLARRTSIELIIVVVLVILFVYTPFKIFFFLL